jgi:hypothetical protein
MCGYMTGGQSGGQNLLAVVPWYRTLTALWGIFQCKFANLAWRWLSHGDRRPLLVSTLVGLGLIWKFPSPREIRTGSQAALIEFMKCFIIQYHPGSLSRSGEAPEEQA